MPLLDPETPEVDFKLFDELSIAFLQSIKAHYTRETATEAMDALVPVLGKEWRSRLIFGLVADTAHQVFTRMQIVRIMSHPNYQKISAIKEVRAISGMSLTEAKNTVEQAELSPVVFYLSSRPEYERVDVYNRRLQTSVEFLRDNGFKVTVL